MSSCINQNCFPDEVGCGPPGPFQLLSSISSPSLPRPPPFRPPLPQCSLPFQAAASRLPNRTVSVQPLGWAAPALASAWNTVLDRRFQDKHMLSGHYLLSYQWHSLHPPLTPGSQHMHIDRDPWFQHGRVTGIRPLTKNQRLHSVGGKKT